MVSKRPYRAVSMRDDYVVRGMVPPTRRQQRTSAMRCRDRGRWSRLGPARGAIEATVERPGHILAVQPKR
jgi:hypothetical protein